MRRRDIIPIVDLCHFGVPDWIGNFQNEDFGRLFAGYAADFADRYPWVQLYTPVNEMFICAMFSAKYGWWNEQMTTDRSEEHMSELQSLMRISYAVFCLKKKNTRYKYNII